MECLFSDLQTKKTAFKNSVTYILKTKFHKSQFTTTITNF